MNKLINYLKKKKSDVISIVFFIALFFGIQWWQTRNLVAKNQEVPEIHLADTEGTEHTLSQYRGKSVVLYFFAPWCTVCKATVSNLEYLKKIRGEKNLQIIIVGLDYSDPSEIIQYKKYHSISSPVLLGDDEITRQFKIQGFPTVYFIDEKGRVSASSLGYISTFGLFYRSL